MTRKLSDGDPFAGAMQKHQKTPSKKNRNIEIGQLSAQNSDFPPLSQQEISDNGSKNGKPNKRLPSDKPPQPGAETTNFDQSGSGPFLAAAEAVVTPVSKQTASRQTCLRVAAAIVALVPLTLLIIAGNLNPEEQGLGTHQQLGLPPCSLRLLAGIRCPACGMTTSWSYFAKGNWLASANTNAGGFLLALLCIAMIATAAQVFRRGHLPSPRVQTWLTIGGAGVLAMTLVDWIIRLQS